MAELTYTAAELAAKLGITARAVRMKGWPYRKTGRGYEYAIQDLPPDVTDKVLSLQDRPKPPARVMQYSTNNRKIGYARQALLQALTASGLSVTDFANQYNKGLIRPDLHQVVGRTSDKTFYRWLKMRREGGDEAVIPMWGEAKRQGSLSPFAAEIFLRYYLQPAGPKIPEAVRLANEFYNLNISVSQARRLLAGESVKPYIVAARRGRADRWNEEFAPYVERNRAILAPMEEIESDHHTLDFFVIGDDGKSFRPHLTSWFDRATGTCLGYVITEQGNTETILFSLYIAVKKFGLPQIIHIDNGADYRSKYAARVMEALGVKVSFAEVYHAQGKTIERWHRTVAGSFARAYPTYCGSDTHSRPDVLNFFIEKAKQELTHNSVINLQAVNRDFGAWVTWYNNEHKQSDMGGRTAREIWGNYQPRFAPDEALHDAFTEKRQQKCRENGVQYAGRFYYATELIDYKGRDVILCVPFLTYEPPERLMICDLKGRLIAHAVKDYFAEQADDRFLAKKRKAAELAKMQGGIEAMVAAVGSPEEGKRNMIDLAVRKYGRAEVERLPVSLQPPAKPITQRGKNPLTRMEDDD
jgi:putative transposase